MLLATEYGTLWMLLHRDPATGRVRRLYRHLGVNLRAQVCTPPPPPHPVKTLYALDRAHFRLVLRDVGVQVDRMCVHMKRVHQISLLDCVVSRHPPLPMCGRIPAPVWSYGVTVYGGCCLRGRSRSGS